MRAGNRGIPRGDPVAAVVAGAFPAAEIGNLILLIALPREVRPRRGTIRLRVVVRRENSRFALQKRRALPRPSARSRKRCSRRERNAASRICLPARHRLLGQAVMSEVNVKACGARRSPPRGRSARACGRARCSSSASSADCIERRRSKPASCSCRRAKISCALSGLASSVISAGGDAVAEKTRVRRRRRRSRAEIARCAAAK